MENNAFKKTGNNKYGKLRGKSIKILRVLRDNPEGLRAETIRKLTGLSQRTIYNNLVKLTDQEIIEHYEPIYRIAKIYALSEEFAMFLNSDDSIQAHKFSFILKLINKPDWWEKRENQLIKLKEYQIKPVIWGKGKYEQIGVGHFLIQTFSNSIIFINQKKYWSNDPYEAFIESLEDTLSQLNYLEERVKFKFYSDGVPQFSVRSHHYVKLRDALAKRCYKEGNFFQLNINGNLRAWLDMSNPKGTEFGHKNYAVEDADKYAKVISDYIDKNASMPTDIDRRINNITNNQLIFAENMKSHVGAVQDLSSGVKEMMEAIRELKNEVSRLKNERK